jgi:hypothetical protein
MSLQHLGSLLNHQHLYVGGNQTHEHNLSNCEP